METFKEYLSILIEITPILVTFVGGLWGVFMFFYQKALKRYKKLESDRKEENERVLESLRNFETLLRESFTKEWDNLESFTNSLSENNKTLNERLSEKALTLNESEETIKKLKAQREWFILACKQMQACLDEPKGSYLRETLKSPVVLWAISQESDFNHITQKTPP